MPLFVGTISGTSIDGIDLALVDIGSTISIEATHTAPIPSALRTRLRDLALARRDGVAEVGRADAELGDLIGQSIVEFLAAERVDAETITAIGSHGQTIRHHPDETRGFTVQIGDPSRIVEQTGITTVADFRRRDMAAAGEGAPLVPLFHQALLAHLEHDVVVLNIGGIANITGLWHSGRINGFDTGPGNALMDAWTLAERQAPFDVNGDWARSGTSNGSFLEILMADDFIHRVPPKSTGKEHYNLDFIRQHQDRWAGDIDAADVQATLLDFTALSIAAAIERWGPRNASVIVCGGGRLNTTLLEALDATIPGDVRPIEAHGYDGDAIEAAAFAWLAAQALAGKPGNAPDVTGANGERVLGAIYPA